MSFETDFLDLMPQSVTIEAFSTLDEYGTKTYAAGTSYTARVVNKVKAVRDVAGVEKVSNTTVYLGGYVAVTVQDKITLPSGFVPQTPPIINVAHFPDEEGLHHTRIYC